MVVKKPMNVNDEDLAYGMTIVEQPLSQPTTMSYSLQRIRLAEISRNIVDRTPLMMVHIGGPSHDVVMDIDTELQMLINDTPPFFSMSIPNLIETYQLAPARAADIFHQGYMFYSLLYAQRCKIHLPFFSKGFRDIAYASSRQECLRSARLIIQTEVKLERCGFCTAERYKFLGLFLAVFMASHVLLVDLCHNNYSYQEEKQRGDIADALRILEEARQESETAARFLDSLLLVLHKHKISPPSRTEQQPPKAGTSGNQLSIQSRRGMPYTAPTNQRYIESDVLSTPMHLAGATRNDDAGTAYVNGDGLTHREDMSSYFNELAQSFKQGLDVGCFDWDSLLSGLQPALI